MQKKIEQILVENKDFWHKYLGRELYNNLLESIPDRMVIAQADYGGETESYIQNLKCCIFEKTSKIDPWLSDVIFAPFYQIIIDTYLQYSNLDFERFIILKDAKTVVKEVVYSSIEQIPLRVLIYDMHCCKNEGRLAGAGSTEEYEYYCQNMLSDVAYVYKLCSGYFEMVRLLVVCMTYTTDFLSEILENIESNRREIVQQLCKGEKFQYITSLEVTGKDSHQKGKKTVRCTLDTGRKIVYKPHTTQKESSYHALYTYFCEHTGNRTVSYPVIDRKTYGMAGYLPEFSCKNREQVKEYFRGMGIHLFLCYLLHAGDMHQENFVASEMPVLVDAETIPGIQRRFMIKSAEDKINDRLSWSVLHTGILPFPVWRDDRKGVIISALHAAREAYSPMKLPVVKKERTSEMYVDYEYIKMFNKNSLPTYKGEQIGAGQYTQDVNEGFTVAYMFYMRNKAQIEEMIEPFWKFETRYLVRHTQQYAIYLSSALHPVFMRSTEEHMLMLQVLQKKKCDMHVMETELSSLINMDTPLLSCKADEYVEYYKSSAYTTHVHLVERFGADDMREQLELIDLSLKMMERECPQNRVTIKSHLNRNKLVQAIQKISDLVEKKATVYEKDICWDSLKLEGENLWSIQAVGTGFYEGVCGIAVFVAFMHKLGYLQKSDIYTLTVSKVCGYADTEAFEAENKTGLYIGVGSLIHTYLMLYHMEEDEKYLTCAHKAAERISEIYGFDQQYDLLSGNAGAIVALAELYEVTNDSKELQWAAEIGDWLVKKVFKLECGKCNITLGGMAHGYSGLIMAYSRLLRHICDWKYCKVIDILLAHEDLSYSEEKGNWRDLRNHESEIYANAWCHGAAGILLSRLYLTELETYRENDIVKRDIGNAVKVLFGQSFRSGLCLCHGMAGNYMIMKEYQKHCLLTSEQEAIMVTMGSGIVDKILTDKILPQDRYSMGFMTGLPGIGVCLGNMLNEDDNISPYFDRIRTKW